MNKKLFALGGLCALAVVGGTLAYFNQTTSVSNPFNTTSFEGTTVEKFNPTDGEDWQPSVEVDKKVYARNTGDGDVWVRIKLEEEWKDAGIKLDSGLDTFLPESEHVSLQKDNGAGGEKDGKTLGDGSVVYKNLDNLDNSHWIKKDGYYYYNQTLKKGNETLPLLKSVTLCTDTDMGYYNSTNYYKLVEREEGKETDEPEFDAGTWEKFEGSLKTALESEPGAKDSDVYTHIVKTLDPIRKGYANDDYTLTITTEFVQADIDGQSARAAGWDLIPTIPSVN